MKSESEFAIRFSLFIRLTWHIRHLDGTLTVAKYYGNKRKGLVSAKLEDADIVVTTYHTLVAEFKTNLSSLHNLMWFRVVLDEGIITQRTEVYC